METTGEERHRKSRKHKKRKRKEVEDAKFEGQVIPGLSKVTEMVKHRDEDAANSSDKKNKKGSSEDDFVLSKLLRKSGFFNKIIEF